mmetsp:Transcript_43228/g.123194  ORF Transcript_43228/g.123194 Transcript_43228/m.123194 type:complete len:211 (-) Transcript_43228:1166-1798(-)
MVIIGEVKAGASHAEAVDDGRMGGEDEQADAPAQNAREHEDGHAEVDDVAHDPGLAAPPDQQLRAAARRAAGRGLLLLLGLAALFLAQRVDGLVGTPQRQEGLPDSDGQEPQHDCRHLLALILDLVPDLVEEPSLGFHDQEEHNTGNEGYPDESHPDGDASNDVGTVVAGGPEGLVQPAPDDAPGGARAADDGHDVERRGERVGLLTPPN